MDTTMHTVDLRYTHQELMALCDVASREDVDAGGRYDCRGGAINVWSHPWTNEASRYDSETIGTLYVNWVADCINRVECATGFAFEDLLHELALLEHKARGSIKHGQERF
jgi:hypothetical protein